MHKSNYLLEQAGSVFVDEKIGAHYRNELVVVPQSEAPLIEDEPAIVEEENHNTALPEILSNERDLTIIAANHNFRRTTSIRSWGRDVEHALKAKINKVKSVIIQQDNEDDTPLKSKTAQIRETLLSLKGEDVKTSKFSSLFGKKSPPKAEISATEFLSQSLEMFEDLKTAIHKDQGRCYGLIDAVQVQSTDFPRYGTALSLHIDVINAQFRKAVDLQTRGAHDAERSLSDSSPDVVRRDLKQRKIDLETSRTIWAMAGDGIEMYVECKNSQDEILQAMYDKIDSDILSLIRAALLKNGAAPQSNSNTSESSEYVLSKVIEQTRIILREIDDVVESGQKFDIAFVEGNPEGLTPLINTATEDIKSLPAPTHF